MDSLSVLLQNLELSAEVFFSGRLCGVQGFTEATLAGHLHLLREGEMSVLTDQRHRVAIRGPSVIFFPTGSRHRIEMLEDEEAELVCASIMFQPDQMSVLVERLPKFVCVELDKGPDIHQASNWIFEEAFSEREGKKVVINRLCDIFIVQLLRYVIGNGTLEIGMLAAYSHPALSKVMDAVRANPEQEWSVESMATLATMSRSKFAALFKETLGMSPMDYLTDLRIALAKGLLQKKRPVNLVANQVGYESSSAFTRVFKKKMGITPKQWLKNYFHIKK